MTSDLACISHLAEHTEYISTAEAVLTAATDTGISYLSASMEPEQRELYITVCDEAGTAWIKHLTTAGYSFSAPVATYSTTRGTVAEAVGNGGRVILHMIREAVK